MIQRIQTLYLLLIVIAEGLLTQFNFINYTNNSSTYNLNVFGIKSAEGIELVSDQKQLVLLCLAVLMSILGIALFNNRKLQKKFVKVLSFVCLAQMAYVTTSCYRLFEQEVESYHLGIGSYLVIAAGLLSILASRAIKKDDDLIKSVDRIR